MLDYGTEDERPCDVTEQMRLSGVAYTHRYALIRNQVCRWVSYELWGLSKGKTVRVTASVPRFPAQSGNTGSCSVGSGTGVMLLNHNVDLVGTNVFKRDSLKQGLNILTSHIEYFLLLHLRWILKCHVNHVFSLERWFKVVFEVVFGGEPQQRHWSTCFCTVLRWFVVVLRSISGTWPIRD